MLPPSMLIVTPGIELVSGSANDQARVTTSSVARASGATHVVIGRSITQAAGPREAFAEALSSQFT
jgi:orotidine-5'-phosphate decarboxylase